jgi:hypothetical protein
MKHFTLIILSILFLNGALKAQSIEELDFSGLWTSTHSENIPGIIGSDYQRIHVKFLSVIKDIDHPDQYFVHGKTMVHGNVCDFQGIIKINELLEDKEPAYDGKSTYNLKAHYRFLEDPKQFHVGIFEGMIVSNLLINAKGTVTYNDLLKNSDTFNNNLFVGTWKEYGAAKGKICNWGDYRIPQSGDLDVGKSKFSLNDKYLKKGWKDFGKANSEIRNWWK